MLAWCSSLHAMCCIKCGARLAQLPICLVGLTSWLGYTKTATHTSLGIAPSGRMECIAKIVCVGEQPASRCIVCKTFSAIREAN